MSRVSQLQDFSSARFNLPSIINPSAHSVGHKLSELKNITDEFIELTHFINKLMKGYCPSPNSVIVPISKIIINYLLSENSCCVFWVVDMLKKEISKYKAYQIVVHKATDLKVSWRCIGRIVKNT